MKTQTLPRIIPAGTEIIESAYKAEFARFVTLERTGGRYVAVARLGSTERHHYAKRGEFVVAA